MRKSTRKKKTPAAKKKVKPEKDRSGEHEEENSLYGSYFLSNAQGKTLRTQYKTAIQNAFKYLKQTLI